MDERDLTVDLGGMAAAVEAIATKADTATTESNGHKAVDPTLYWGETAEVNGNGQGSQARQEGHDHMTAPASDTRAAGNGNSHLVEPNGGRPHVVPSRRFRNPYNERPRPVRSNGNGHGPAVNADKFEWGQNPLPKVSIDRTHEPETAVARMADPTKQAVEADTINRFRTAGLISRHRTSRASRSYKAEARAQRAAQEAGVATEVNDAPEKRHRIRSFYQKIGSIATMTVIKVNGGIRSGWEKLTQAETANGRRRKVAAVVGVAALAAVAIDFALRTKGHHGIEAVLPKPKGGQELIPGKTHSVINHLPIDNRPSPKPISQVLPKSAPVHQAPLASFEVRPGGGGATAVQQYAAEHGIKLTKAESYRLFEKVREVTGDHGVETGVGSYDHAGDLRYLVGKGKWTEQALETLNESLGLAA